MNNIFAPLTLRGVTLRNRYALSPMCQYSARDGYINDYHAVHYGRFALGGFGLLMVEATAVSPEGRITHGDLGLWDDAHIPGLARIAAFAKSYGATPGIQIAHAGPKASIQRAFEGNGPLNEADAARGEHPWQVVSPSARPVADGWLTPDALDAQGIAKVRADFIASARRALQAGFDVLELHYAHGFLLNAFLSPLTNDRTDEYGGSFDNRIRLPLAIAREVRALWPQDKPLFVRLSAVDGGSNGWTIADSVAFAKILKEVGVDVIDCSSGGFNVYEYPNGYSFQVPFAAQIRREAEIGTMAVGMIVDPQQAQAVIASGEADLVALGHAALHDPHFPLHAQQQMAAADWNIQAGWWLEHRQHKLQQLGPWVASSTKRETMNKPTYVHDYQAIVAVLNQYNDGCKQADSSIMKPAFNARATMFSVDGNGKLAGGGIQTLFDGIDSGFTPSPEAQGAIVRVDIVGSAASARIDSNDVSGFCFTDFFHLLKVAGQWTVISKIFHTHVAP